MKNLKSYGLILLMFCISAASCKKDWLDEKSDISRIVPVTLKDMHLLLNHDRFNTSYLAIAEGSADDILLTDAAFNAGSLLHRSAYTWEPDIFPGSSTVSQWDGNYNQVFTANVVLEGLDKIKPAADKLTEWNDLKGRALFFRARAFTELLILFAKPYNLSTAKSDPGIALRLVPDIDVPASRANVHECYEQVIKDLTEAKALLKPLAAVKTEPSQASAAALLARVYLSMQEYDNALKAADESLQLYNSLIDFNTLNAAAANPFTRFNIETTFYSLQTLFSIINNSTVDPALLNAYSPNDLRKAMFYKKNADGSFMFKGSYTGDALLFSGTSSNEVYLIQAECNARLGNISKAINGLNTLLIKRYKTGTLIPLQATGPEQAISIVLQERRKELVFRSLRWQDLRRLNSDPKYAVTITRAVNNKIYVLPPADPKYTFPIPSYVVNSSGIEQNPR